VNNWKYEMENKKNNELYMKQHARITKKRESRKGNDNLSIKKIKGLGK
jgi:hypothetical protein